MHHLRYSQNDLLEGILANNASILRYVYRVYYPSIRHLILSNTGSEEDARDIFQEVMLVFYRKLKQEEFRLSSSLMTYLYSIARRIWLKHLVKTQNRGEIVDTIPDQLLDDEEILPAIERNERLELFYEKFEELSPDCQRILKMFLNNIPISEITSSMGYRTDQHTKNRRFRCKTSLIKRIKSSNKYLELGNGKNKSDSEIPRW